MNPLIKFTSLGILAAGVVFASVAADFDAASTSNEIAELKKGQEALRKDLDEIKKKLAALTAPPPRPQVVEKIDAVVSVGNLKALGQNDAPLTLVEFSDYQCPFCARHVSQTVPKLVKDYIETGKLRYVFRDFPLESIHPNAQKAAEAARCAGEKDRYWQMHDKLFANQSQLQLAKLVEYAKSIGLDEAEFGACLNSGKYAGSVGKDIEQGNALGVRGTPTLVLGRSDGDRVKDAVMIRGAHPAAVFIAEIDKMLAGNGSAKD